MLDVTDGLVRTLGKDGDVRDDKSVSLTDEQLRDLYKSMLFARLVDERALRLQRQGRIMGWPPFTGQEAAQIGSASALERTDSMFPSYRDTGASLTFGMELEELLLFWMGYPGRGRPPTDVSIFPISIVISTQIPHAVGTAWASKLKNDGRATLCYFGDGATSKGDFHEGLNFAAINKVPLVALCQNNGWAISVPIEKQSGNPNISQKAVSYGMEGVRVDGNDVLAVYEVTKQALDKARAGEGPTLIEAVTYRVGPHGNADDTKRYREEQESQRWRDLDPLKRFRAFLSGRNLWNEADEEQATAEAKERISQAVKAAEKVPRPRLADSFDHVFAAPTGTLRSQLESVLAYEDSEGT